MDFQTAVRTCLTEKYARFEGRASRSEYWWFVLACVIAGIVVSAIAGLTGLYFLQWLLTLALLSPGVGAGYRRLQDTGKPGWYILIPTAVGLLGWLVAPGPVVMDANGMPTQMPGMFSILLGGLLAIVQLVLAVIFIWWLTRPSEPGTNAYGPPPAA